MKIKFFISISFWCFYFMIINRNFKKYIKNKGKRVGIIGYINDNNIGNILLKYSMFVLLKSFGLNPILISLKDDKKNIDFLKNNLIMKEITDYYTQLKEDDYDFLLVNSDQAWCYRSKYILEIGFLSFAENWKIPKIVYGASLAHSHWNISKKVLNSAKKLVKQFKGISVREYNSIKIIKNNLGVEPNFVLDPTMLISKDEYLKIIKNYKMDIDFKKNYLCSYILDESTTLINYINDVSNYLKYNIIYIQLNVTNYIEKFIFSLNICKSVITDSFHGTVFAIIFNKPFITFINNLRGNIRFFSLKETFELHNRFIYPKKFDKNDSYVLKNNPNINETKLNLLKLKSIEFIKKNLLIKKL